MIIQIWVCQCLKQTAVSSERIWKTNVLKCAEMWKRLKINLWPSFLLSKAEFQVNSLSCSYQPLNLTTTFISSSINRTCFRSDVNAGEIVYRRPLISQNENKKLKRKTCWIWNYSIRVEHINIRRNIQLRYITQELECVVRLSQGLLHTQQNWNSCCINDNSLRRNKFSTR